MLYNYLSYELYVPTIVYSDSFAENTIKIMKWNTKNKLKAKGTRLLLYSQNWSYPSDTFDMSQIDRELSWIADGGWWKLYYTSPNLGWNILKFYFWYVCKMNTTQSNILNQRLLRILVWIFQIKSILL